MRRRHNKATSNQPPLIPIGKKMVNSMKPIRLSAHTHENLKFRGCTEEEIVDSIRSVSWTPAELGRWECRKNYSYMKEWNGKFYALKQVRTIFMEEEKEIVIVTVYVYYIKSEE
jgi:hypothetical protein